MLNKYALISVIILSTSSLYSYTNFSKLACSCCHLYNMNTEFLKELKVLENKMDKNFIITSGTRC